MAVIAGLVGAVGLLVAVVHDLQGRMAIQADRAEQLAEDLAATDSHVAQVNSQLTSLRDQITTLEDQLADMDVRLSDAIPRLRGIAGRRFCADQAAVVAIPVGWTIQCGDLSPDRSLFGEAFGRPSNGRIVVYVGEHLAEFGWTQRTRAELIDTIHHEAHHAWCVASHGIPGHDGPVVPTCTVPVAVGPPVGQWGGEDG